MKNSKKSVDGTIRLRNGLTLVFKIFNIYCVEKLIFCKLLNIEIVLNDLKKPMSDYFDRIMDLYLKPLRSKISRTIFNIFIEYKQGSLTTIDLQSKLKEMDIKLDKKEINWWLKGLQEAELIMKESQRGKPTTLVYNDKYTFDLWKITETGLSITEGLNRILDSRSIYLDQDPIDILKIVSMYVDEKGKILERLKEIYFMMCLLKVLSATEGWVNQKDLMSRMSPNQEEMAQFLSLYSNDVHGSRMLTSRLLKSGLKGKFLNIFGLMSDHEYLLTEEAKMLSKKLGY